MALLAPKNKIRVLPRDLAEKIAAGEVVERPASVIKELVENSIDAGARQIQIELEEGGRNKIRIIDDGHGIPDEEVLIALERHATSKVSSLDDLWNIRTMGFRGEALPSIATVSRFTLETKAAQNNGRKVYLEGGRLLKDELGAQLLHSGTVITVENLFFNVPARLKFLKSKSGEVGFVRELLERIALSHPQVGFRLLSEGRKSLDLAPVTNSQSRFAEILETKTSEIEIFENQFESIRLTGFFDRNERATNSRHVFLSVNGRMVRDKLLQQAVLVGLRPCMMEGEYPRIYVALEVPPQDVDVNVHPAKSEVRFRNARDVFQVVHGALYKIATKPGQVAYEVNLEIDSSGHARATAQQNIQNSVEQNGLFSNERVSYKTKPDLVPSSLTASEPGIKTPMPDLSSPKNTFTTLHYIGQLKNTYLLFQDNDSLVIIDQHAAHERINYEKIKADFFQNGLRAQPLLVSIPVKCKPDDVALGLDFKDSFLQLGFELEAFGDDCLLLRTAPENLDPAKAAELFRSLLAEIKESEAAELTTKDPTRVSAKLERILATSACHSSIRAGQALSPSEAKALVAEMEQTPSSLNCPHGRPASIRLQFTQIESLFKRS